MSLNYNNIDMVCMKACPKTYKSPLVIMNIVKLAMNQFSLKGKNNKNIFG